MIETMIVTFVIMFAIIFMMSIGFWIDKKPIKGSCGGLGALGLKDGCEICGGDKKSLDDGGQTLSKEDVQRMTYNASEND